MRGFGYLRELLGVIVLDVPRYSTSLLRPRGWVRVGNRIDRREISTDGSAVRVLDDWATPLHACAVLPPLGAWLFQRAFSEWPIRFELTPRKSKQIPDVSFIIPHRGPERVPVLCKVIESVFAQEGVCVECLVVEQDQRPRIESLPDGVRHIHVPHPTDASGWHKSLAFNAGVRAAASEIVICHDGDVLVPCGYAHAMLRRFQMGLEVVFPQRFLFYMTRGQSDRLVRGGAIPTWLHPESIRQNWKGGTFAIRRSAYARIGGFDERFVGWTGEDVEFFDRCRVLPGWFHGYIPFIHLWHAPQPTKMGVARDTNLRFFREVMAVSRGDRIDRLRAVAGARDMERS